MKISYRQYIGLIVLVLACAMLCIGCKKSEDKKEEEYVLTIKDTKVSKSEAMWALYLLEKEYKKDADEYREKNKASYWSSKYDKANTVGDLLKAKAIETVTRNEILYMEAESTGRYKIENEKEFEEYADKQMEEITNQLKTFGLTRESYLEYIKKQAVANTFYQESLGLYKIDKDKIKKDNPYDKKKYKSEDEYNKHIDELILEDKKAQFDKDYQILLNGKYGAEINYDTWKSVAVGQMAALMIEKKDK